MLTPTVQCLEGTEWGTLPLSACPSMTPWEQAAGGESVPNPRHCTKILTAGRGGVARGEAPISGTPLFWVTQSQIRQITCRYNIWGDGAGEL